MPIDPETIVRSVCERTRQILDDRDRGQWMEARLQRGAKYRGWLAEKTWPWPQASNVHIPMLQIAEQRTNAGLHNVIMSLRPLLTAKASQRAHVEKEERITHLIDAQLFLDPGPERAERVFGDFVASFLQDGNAVLFTPWVRDERRVVTLHHRPKPSNGLDPMLDADEAVRGLAQELYPRGVELVESDGLRFEFSVARMGAEPQPVTMRIYDAERGFEIEVEREETLYDGPVCIPLSITQVLVPTRCENLQPPSEWNPLGAPYVVLEVNARLSEIRRWRATGKFNWVTDEGLTAIETQAQAQAGTQPAEAQEDRRELQKDEFEGRTHEQSLTPTGKETGHLEVTLWICFDRWPIRDETVDTYWVIARDAKVLCEARRLTELWPAVRPYRPLAEAVALPVPGRYYGISLLEVGEALSDLVKGTFDQAYDSATVSNMPFFFYAAASKLSTNIIRLAPGEGYPVPGNPRETVWFPALPTRDQSWAFQVIGLAMQFFERQMMQGPLQYGQVPTGKASALRTFGTTAALLQQGDVRMDQLLLRCFSGLRQVARNFHAMNRYLLPPGKEIRILGWEGKAEQGYLPIDPKDVEADMDFDFRPDFLLSSGPALTDALTKLMMTVGTPLAFSLGTTTPQLFYQAIRDYVRSLRLDPKQYLQRPAESGEPPIMAEEAISQIFAGRRPTGSPLEGPEPHLKKLQAFVASDQFGLLTPDQLQLFRAYTQTVVEAFRQAQILQAAQQFQAAMQQGASGGAPMMMAGQEPSMGEGPLAQPTAREGTGIS